MTRSGRGLLRVDRLVQRAMLVEQASLAQFSRVTLDEPFTCEEGWRVRDLRRRGVRLLDILGLALPLLEARFVRICAGAYVLPLSLAEAGVALLCDELNGRPLEAEHGAPA